MSQFFIKLIRLFDISPAFPLSYSYFTKWTLVALAVFVRLSLQRWQRIREKEKVLQATENERTVPVIAVPAAQKSFRTDVVESVRLVSSLSATRPPRTMTTHINENARQHSRLFCVQRNITTTIYTVSQKKTWCRTFCNNFIISRLWKFFHYCKAIINIS